VSVTEPDWLAEKLYADWAQAFRVTKEVAQETSEFQHVRVVETAGHGFILLLDGVVQITEADEFVYQEMISHVPLIHHGCARRVLIIGAGDGGVLRRVLQHGAVEQATMVEIDEAVIRLSKAHLPSIAGDAWADPRADVIVGDGIAFAAAADSGSFDVIIVDSTDPAGPGESLFTEAFYRDCARVLTTDGLLVNQCGVPFMQAEELRDTTALRRRVFEYTSAYVAAVPTYVGGFMALGVASNTPILPIEPAELSARAIRSGIAGKTRYWSPNVHAASFALPPYISCLVSEVGLVVRDQAPS
jgi:spermidine synthase